MLNVARGVIAGLLLAPAISLATPIKVDFTVTAALAYQTDTANEDLGDSYDGLPLGTTASASFVFDSSVGSFLDQNGPGMAVLSGLNFNWLGVEWNDTNTVLYRAEFDTVGNLVAWGIGSPLSCGAGCFSLPGPTDFIMDGATAPLALYGTGGEHHEGVPGWMFATLTWSAAEVPVEPPVGVPEPGTTSLLGLGLLGLAIAMRRKRNA